MDDGSVDDTSRLARAAFSGELTILAGNGRLYWAGGMRLAVSHAPSGADVYLFLNDDTFLRQSALNRLASTLEVAQSKSQLHHGVAVGVTSGDGRQTYGGWRSRTPLIPLWLEYVPTQPGNLPCDTFNGNCILMSRDTYEYLGGLDPIFSHGMADFDLGFRAKHKSVPALIVDEPVAECRHNRDVVPNRRQGNGLSTDWRAFTSPKRFPPREWLVFAYRHGGIIWPLVFVAPYIRFFISYLRRLD